jgi:hypothetical protein
MEMLGDAPVKPTKQELFISYTVQEELCVKFPTPLTN